MLGSLWLAYFSATCKIWKTKNDLLTMNYQRRTSHQILSFQSLFLQFTKHHKKKFLNITPNKVIHSKIFWTKENQLNWHPVAFSNARHIFLPSDVASGRYFARRYFWTNNMKWISMPLKNQFVRKIKTIKSVNFVWKQWTNWQNASKIRLWVIHIPVGGFWYGK